MKRFILVLCFWLVGIASANQPEYPPITAENQALLKEVARFGYGPMNFGIAWSPNGSSFLIGGWHGIFYYENIDTEPEFIELGMAAYSPFFASENLLFFRNDQRLLAYELNERRILYELRGEKALAVSNNGRLLAYALDNGLAVLEIASGNVLYSLSLEGLLGEEYTNETSWQENFVFLTQFCPNDNCLIIGWQKQQAVGTGYFQEIGATIWLLNSNELRAIRDWYTLAPEFANLVLLPDAGGVYADNLERLVNLSTGRFNDNEPYAFSGTYLATSYGSSIYEEENFERFTGIWNIHTGELLTTVPEIGSMHFSPDGTKIAINNTVYSLPSGEVLQNFRSDEYTLLTGSPERYLWRDAANRLHLMDGLSFEEIALLPFLGGEWYPERGKESDGSFILMRDDRQAFVRLDAETGAVMTTYRTNQRIAYQYPNSNLSLIYGNLSNGETVWNYATGQVINLPYNYQLMNPKFHPAGAIVAWDTVAEEVHLYDAINSTVLASFPYEDGLPLVNFSPDGRYVALGTGDTREIWSVDEQRHLFTANLYAETFVFSRDSQYLVSLVANDEIRIVRISNGIVLRHIRVGQAIIGLQSFSPNTVCAVYPEDSPDESYWCFDVARGDTLPYPRNSFISFDFAEQESLIFSLDGTSIVISTRAGETTREIDLPLNVQHIAMGSDGSRIFVNYSDEILSVWAVEE